MTDYVKNKKPFIHIRDEEFSPRYHPDSFDKQTLFVTITGSPGADYFNSPAQSLLRAVRRVRSFDEVSRGHWCWASTSLSQLADGMTYYSCFDFYFGRDNPALTLCGPRGIRTLDLLNAIETRSQLRYGPI